MKLNFRPSSSHAQIPMQSQQLRAQLNNAMQQQRFNQLQTAALSPPSSSQEPPPPTSPSPSAQRAEQTTPSSAEQGSVPQAPTRDVQSPSQSQPPETTEGQSASQLNPQTPNVRPPRNLQPHTPLGQALPPLPPRTPNTDSMPHLNSQTPRVQSRPNLPPHTRSQSILPINQEYSRYEHLESVANSESPSYHNPYSRGYDRRYNRHRYDYSRATDYGSEVFPNHSRRSHANSARSTLFYIFVTIIVICTPLVLFNTDVSVTNMYDSAQSLFHRFDPRNAVNWSDTIIWKGPANVLNKIRNESALSMRSRRNYSYVGKPSNGIEKTSLWSRFVKNRLGSKGHQGKRDNQIPKGALDDSFTQDDDSWMNREEPISQDDAGFSIHGQHGGINSPTSVAPTPTPTPTIAYHLAHGNNEASVDSNRQYYPNFKTQFERNGESDNTARITALGNDGYGYKSQIDYLRQTYPLKHGTGNAIEMPSVPPQQMTLQMDQPHLYQPTRAVTTPNYQTHQWGHQSSMQLPQISVWGPQRVVPSPSNFYANGYGNQYSQIARSHSYQHNTQITHPSRFSQPLATDHQVSGMSQSQTEHRGYSNSLLMPTPNPVGAIQFPHEQLQASNSLQAKRVEPHHLRNNVDHVGYSSSGYGYTSDHTNQRRYPHPQHPKFYG